MIHKTAIIDDSAVIAKSASIGPNVIIGEGVKIGENVKIISNAFLEHCEIGDGTVISPFASIGTPPQDLGYKGEPTKAIIGKDCLIKEYVTVNRASGEGNSTVIGNHCMLMASAHVAHNCKVADEVIMANLATIGGHVVVEYGAFLGGMSVFHQNIRFGEMAIVSGFSAARMDLLPYTKCDGRPAALRGINAIGLKRKGVGIEDRNAIKNALKIICSGEYLLRQTADIIEKEYPENKYVKHMADFIRTSKRGLWINQKGAVEDE